jgi:hypothetical protein
VNYVGPGDRVSEVWLIEMGMGGSGRGLTDPLSRHLPGGTEDSHEKPQ